MPSSVPKIRYWSKKGILVLKHNQYFEEFEVSRWANRLWPLVSGWIQEVAQLIFSGQPSKTLEKQAPIWKAKQWEVRRTKALGSNKLESVPLTRTLGVGGSPLIAGFCKRDKTLNVAQHKSWIFILENWSTWMLLFLQVLALNGMKHASGKSPETKFELCLLYSWKLRLLKKKNK